MSRLKERLIERIQAQGPLTVAEYMALCLLDPVDGYYPTRDPLGKEGDFITAPEISQMFGELLGLWALQSWIDMGKPAKVQLVEMGPGRGIMMADMLRAAQLDKDFIKAVNVTLIEASSALEAVQAKTLANAPCPVSWTTDLAEVEAGAIIIVGNEFLDCLPVRQFVQKDRFAGRAGWQERVVGYIDGQLQYALSPVPLSEVLQASLPAEQSEAKNDELLEVSPSVAQVLEQISARFMQSAGRALFIDYGPAQTEFGDSLQALKRHKKVGVFSDPGNTDLTARVDFSAFIQAARAVDMAVTKPAEQREFLSKLGLEMRAMTLARAVPDSKAKIGRQLHRLTDSEEMGALFKAIAVQSGGLDLPLGFKSFAGEMT